MCCVFWFSIPKGSQIVAWGVAALNPRLQSWTTPWSSEKSLKNLSLSLSWWHWTHVDRSYFIHLFAY